MEDEVLNDGEIIEAVAIYDRAVKAVEKANAKKLVKADGKAHNFRVGAWTISQTPKGDPRDTHVVPKNPTRRFKKVAEDTGGESDG